MISMEGNHAKYMHIHKVKHELAFLHCTAHIAKTKIYSNMLSYVCSLEDESGSVRLVRHWQKMSAKSQMKLY